MRSEGVEGVEGGAGGRAFHSPWLAARAQRRGTEAGAWSGGAIVLGVLTGLVAIGHVVMDGSMIALLMSGAFLEGLAASDAEEALTVAMRRYAWIELGLSGLWFALMAWVYALARSIAAQIVILVLGVAMPFLGTVVFLYPALLAASTP